MAVGGLAVCQSGVSRRDGRGVGSDGRAAPDAPGSRARCRLNEPSGQQFPGERQAPVTTALSHLPFRKPTVALGVTSVVAYTYGCDDGRISPTRCAVVYLQPAAKYKKQLPQNLR